MRDAVESSRVARARTEERAQARPPHPRVSVVLPTFGRPDLLPRAVDSVRHQTFESWELIVVDDNPPGSEARAATHGFMETSRDPRFVYVAHDERRGGGAARNTGIARARGELIAFLDDDDEWAPEKLERQAARFDGAATDLALVYCGFERRMTDGRSRTEIPPRGAHDFGALLCKNRVGGTSAVLCRKTALDHIGGFDEQLASKQDIDLYLRLAKRFRMEAIPRVLFVRHHHDGATVTKRVEGRLQAHAYFERKYTDELRRHPTAERELEKARSRLLLESGRVAQARRVALGAAWRAPWDTGAWRLALRCTAPAEALRRRKTAREARATSGAAESTYGS